MLDTFCTLLEIAERIVRNFNFVKWRNDARLAEVGAKLYAIMTSANESVMTGNEIVRAMRAFLQNDRIKKVFAAELPYTKALEIGVGLQRPLLFHMHNLKRFAESLDDAGQELQILDPETYRKLVALKDRKISSLAYFFGSFSEDSMPLSGISVERIDEIIAGRLARRNFDLTVDEGASIKVGVRWGPAEYERLDKYFARANPVQQLAELERLVRSIRSTLEQHFDVKDILLRLDREEKRS